jgi:dipeptidyl aminopeptidase/acylaminoacyl peptidase
MRRFCAVPLAVLLLAPAGPPSAALEPARAQAVRPVPLTVDSIMRGPDLVGYPPTGLRWALDSQQLFFDWRRPGEKEASTYVVGRDGRNPRRLTEDEAQHAPPADGERDKAGRRVLFADGGDIAVHEGRTGRRVRITRTSAAESHPRWARNDTHVTFVRDGNLFVVPVAEGGAAILTQLTDVKAAQPEPRLTESQRFLREEEQKLIQRVRELKEEREKAEAKARKENPPTFELQERQSAADLMLSPDGSHVFILVSERPADAKTAVVPNYVTESGYTEQVETRTNVGDTQERRLLAILNTKTGASVWADGSFAPPVAEEGGNEKDPKEDRKEDTKKDTKKDTKEDAGKETAKTPPPGSRAHREIRWSMPVVSDDGRHVVAAARSADNKERWFVTLDPETGKTTVIDHLRDAWIREAAFGGGALDFLPDNRRIAFLSERDGWMHLYTLDVAAGGATPRQLTSGRWEVASAALAPDGSRFYITTTEVHPGERHVYALPLDGGERTRLTAMDGSNEATPSPDGSMLALVHSYSTKPPEVYLMANRPQARAVQVTTTPTAEWRAVDWIDPQLITFTARDGVDVHARLFTPEMIGAARDPLRPGVVFVHGAGYLQNAHRYWSTYFREYMFHNLLAAQGYVVLDVDYRASAGYGRDWRTSIYRHMGGKDLEDIVDGARYLVERERVHPARLGVYGGSYGGFITLMAMFTTPDVFAAGAALRPVTDWAHYNHGYTSNILNLPHEDAEAYRRSSPIYFAEGLKGALLICHGMVDVNVHFQDSVRLAQRLIELRKENWELAVYPVEDHAFTEETSWADEYRRILKLFETHLRSRDAGAAGEGAARQVQ